MQPLIIASGANGLSTFSIPVPDSTSVNGVVLAAGTAKSITVPSGATHALFSATDDFYANYTGTATVITDTTNGSGSELNPVIRTLLAATTISVIAAQATNVTVTFYT